MIFALILVSLSVLASCSTGSKKLEMETEQAEKGTARENLGATEAQDLSENTEVTTEKVVEEPKALGLEDREWVGLYEGILRGEESTTYLFEEYLTLDGDSIKFLDYNQDPINIYYRLYWPEGLEYPALILKSDEFIFRGQETKLPLFRTVIITMLENGDVRKDGYLTYGESLPVHNLMLDEKGNLVKVDEDYYVLVYKIEDSSLIYDWGFDVSITGIDEKEYLKGDVGTHTFSPEDLNYTGKRDSIEDLEPMFNRVIKSEASSSSKEEMDEFVDSLEVFEVKDNSISDYQRVVEEVLAEKEK